MQTTVLHTGQMNMRFLCYFNNLLMMMSYAKPGRQHHHTIDACKPAALYLGQMQCIRVYRNLMVSLACCLGMLLLPACQQELPIAEAPPPLAVVPVPNDALYRFTDSGGRCAPIVINGFYVVGYPPDSSSNIEATVHVTKTGAYAVETERINGLQFAAKGRFTDTGFTTIRLYANGGVLAAATNVFTLRQGSSCRFTIVSRAPQAAQYVLRGQPGNCINAVVHGGYLSSFESTLDDSVVLEVEVLQPGLYSISTDTVQGMWYRGSGYLSQPGTQTIKLQARGTPVQPGIHVFKPSGGGTQCSFAVNVGFGVREATFVIESNGGAGTPCRSVLSGLYRSGEMLTSSHTLQLTVVVSRIGSYSIATATVNGFQFATTGSFTSTGMQQVTLAGIGTPLQRGTVIMRPQIVGASPIGGSICNTEVQVQ